MNVGSPVGYIGPSEAAMKFSSDVELLCDIREVVLEVRARATSTDCGISLPDDAMRPPSHPTSLVLTPWPGGL